MAAIDYAGLLTGISGQNQKADPFSMPTAAQQRMAFGAQTSQGMQQGLGGLFGMTPQQSPVELAKTELVKLDRADPQYEQKFIKLLSIADPAKAAEVQQKQAMNEEKKNERASLADYLEVEYGDKATKLRPAIMTGAINASNWDKVFREEDKKERTPRNVTYKDSDGNTQQQLVFFDSTGSTFDERNSPLVLPDDAQLTITGRTPADVEEGVSGFTPKEAAAVRDDILNSRAQLRVLKGVTNESIDKYLTSLGKAQAWAGKNLSSLKGLGGDAANAAIKAATGVDLQEFAGQQGVLFGDLENYFNKKRHDVTGAAAAISELKDLRKGILSGETSPAVAKARIVQIMQKEQESIDLNFELLKTNGLDVSSYFDPKANNPATTDKPSVALTVPAQEAKLTIDRILKSALTQKKED